MEQAKEAHVFESMDDFFVYINQYTLQTLHPSLMEFHSAYSAIGKGCGCGRKKRLASAKEAYIRIKEIDPGIALEFKRIFVAKKIILKHEGVILAYME